MKNIVFALVLILLCSCELIVLGGKKKQSIDISQKTPVGAVLLFKTKLDSNKIPDATSLMVRPSGEQYLAIEKYELYDDLNRLSRVIGHRTVTNFKSDSLSESDYKVNVEFDYVRKVLFSTKKIDSEWFISSIKD